MIPELAIKDAVTLIAAIVAIAGAYAGSKAGQRETERLVRALHGRFDKLEQSHNDLRLEHTATRTIVDLIKQTGKFQFNQVPLFKDDK